MKTNEEIAQETANVVLDYCGNIRCNGSYPDPDAYGIILAALQQREQEHEAQVASLTKERDEAREDTKRLRDVLTLLVDCDSSTHEYIRRKQAARDALKQAMTGGAE